MLNERLLIDVCFAIPLLKNLKVYMENYLSQSGMATNPDCFLTNKIKMVFKKFCLSMENLLKIILLYTVLVKEAKI